MIVENEILVHVFSIKQYYTFWKHFTHEVCFLDFGSVITEGEI